MEKQISIRRKYESTKVRIICALMMGLLSVMAFCETKILAESSGSILEVLQLFNEQAGHMEILLVTAWLGISGLYMHWMKRVERKFNVGIAGISILFPFFTSLHASMPNVNAVTNPNSVLLLLHMSGYFIIYYVVIMYLYAYLFEFSGKINQEAVLFSRKKMFVSSFICLFLLRVRILLCVLLEI